MLKIRLSPDCDLSGMAFKNAVGKLETTPDKVEILCSAHNAVTATELAKMYGCRMVLIPPELLANQFCWAVRNESATVWSLPSA